MPLLSGVLLGVFVLFVLFVFVLLLYYIIFIILLLYYIYLLFYYIIILYYRVRISAAKRASSSSTFVSRCFFCSKTLKKTNALIDKSIFEKKLTYTCKWIDVSSSENERAQTYYKADVFLLLQNIEEEKTHTETLVLDVS